MPKRPRQRRAEYDKSVAWIACHATPASLAPLVLLVADQFGQNPRDVSSDVSDARKRSDVQRGSKESQLVFAALYAMQIGRSDPARGV